MRAIAAFISLLLLASGAAAQASAPSSYPSKSVRLIVPYAPGGTTDALSRLVAQRLSDSLGQQVIIDNRPGADTIIGIDALAKAAPDGYTIGFTSGNSIAVLPHTRKRLPYDPFKDFVHIAQIADAQFLLAVNSSTPAMNVRELVALARSKPGKLTYASASEAGHVTAEMFKLATGTDIVHVPYKGGAPATTDLLSGQVDMMFTAFGNAIPHVRAGKLRALAVTGGRRAASLPDVPTLREAGIKDFESVGLYGISGPHGTPQAIVKRLNEEINAVLKMPDTAAKFLAQGVDPMGGTPEEYIGALRALSEQYRSVLHRIGYQPE